MPAGLYTWSEVHVRKQDEKCWLWYGACTRSCSLQATGQRSPRMFWNDHMNNIMQDSFVELKTGKLRGCFSSPSEGTWTKTGSTGTCGASLSAKCNDSWYSIEWRCSMRENTSDMSDWVSAVIISHTEEWFKRWSWSDRFVSYKIPNQQEHQKWREESQHEVVLPALRTLNWHTEEEDPTMENKRDGWTLVPFVSTMVFQKERLPYWNVVFLTQ